MLRPSINFSEKYQDEIVLCFANQIFILFIKPNFLFLISKYFEKNEEKIYWEYVFENLRLYLRGFIAGSEQITPPQIKNS